MDMEGSLEGAWGVSFGLLTMGSSADSTHMPLRGTTCNAAHSVANGRVLHDHAWMSPTSPVIGSATKWSHLALSQAPAGDMTVERV